MSNLYIISGCNCAGKTATLYSLICDNGCFQTTLKGNHEGGTEKIEDTELNILLPELWGNIKKNKK